MKRFVSIIGLLASVVISNGQQLIPWTTNIANGTCVLVTTNRLNIRQVQISAAQDSVKFEIFNNDSLATPKFGTNYTLSSYVSKNSYSTNIWSSFIDSGGVTNYYTNSGIFTYSVTNAASTNVLSPSFVGYAQPNTVISFNTDILNEKGTVIRASTNCSVVLYYNLGQ